MLVVDDSPAELELLELAFGEHAVPPDFHAAASGPEAMRVLASLEAAGLLPELILIDLNMPGDGSWPLLAELHAGRHAGIRRVVMSSVGPAAALEKRLREVGIRTCLIKPTGFPAYTRFIESLMTGIAIACGLVATMRASLLGPRARRAAASAA
ncbi:MAG TPA: response regulator [Planctomycetota bacterium]|nr:response regulator [Planctomycetota bacterium]